MFGNEAHFKYLGARVTNQSLILEEIKSTLISGNACSYSAQNLLVSLSNNVKLRTYKTLILPVVLYGFETWSLTFKEEAQTEGV
jgi:hypothetical protein